MTLLIVLADGFEEIEAVTIIDVLRRAHIEIKTIGLNSKKVEGAHGIEMSLQKTLTDIEENSFEGLILPGGSKGVENLSHSRELIEIIKNFNSQEKMIAAICAAPLILNKAGILKDRKATIYPTLKEKIENFKDKNVVEDNNIITSKGPGTAMEFALQIVKNLKNEEELKKVKERLLA